MFESESNSKPIVLIVDDDPINIKVLNTMLKADYEIIVALNGVQAFERINNDLIPDLILLDITMPDMDGYEVCINLKSSMETNDIPVIFITAMSDEEDEKKGLELGAADYITKPFHSAIVMARINNHLKLKHYQDQLKLQSNIDQVTGISNRRCFDEFLNREWSHGIRKGFPLSLIMMDIDYFKPFNDNYGHFAGDICLRKVAQTLESSGERSTDFVGRYGGEEFACILSDTILKGALSVAEKMRVIISDLDIRHEFSKIANHVTISLGVATIEPSRGCAPEKLIKLTDEMLYKAKENGRNRVEGK